MSQVQALPISHLGAGYQTVQVTEDAQLLTVSETSYGPVLHWLGGVGYQHPKPVVVASDTMPLPDLPLRWIGTWAVGPGIYYHLFEVLS